MTYLMSKDNFMREVDFFRKIVANKSVSIEKMDRAVGILFLLVNRSPPSCLPVWECLYTEWTHRKKLLILHGHPLED